MSRWRGVGTAGSIAILLSSGCGPGAVGVEPSAPSNAKPTVAEAAPAPTDAPPAAEPDLRAGPDLYKIMMGVDSPDDVAGKIGASDGPIVCPADLLPDGTLNAAEKKTEKRRKTICWRASGLKDAPQVRATFYDYGIGLVVDDLWFVYPLGSLSWLPDAMRSTLGPPDTVDVNAPMQSWSWGHTEVALGRQDCKNAMEPSTCKVAAVGITHWPTLSLSVRGVTDRSRSVADRSKPASPWDIRFGYDSASVSEAKLRAAGFFVNTLGCIDGSPGVRRCYMDGGSLRGLRNNTEVELVNPANGTAIAQLTYTFDLPVFADTLRQLTETYGKPVVEDDYGKWKWWTGEVGIELWRRDDQFHVTYFHGRLQQLSYKAMELEKAAEAKAQKRGL